MSMVVPAVIGATIVMTREGYWSSAWACVASPIHPASKAANSAVTRMVFPSDSCCSFRKSAERDGADRRGFGADQVERQADQREAILFDAIEILQIRHGDDAVLAERARIVEGARRVRLVIAMIEIVTDDHHAL